MSELKELQIGESKSQVSCFKYDGKEIGGSSNDWTTVECTVDEDGFISFPNKDCDMDLLGGFEISINGTTDVAWFNTIYVLNGNSGTYSLVADLGLGYVIQTVDSPTEFRADLNLAYPTPDWGGKFNSLWPGDDDDPNSDHFLVNLHCFENLTGTEGDVATVKYRKTTGTSIKHYYCV